MSEKYVAYVGSYTRGESEGITILDLNPEYAYYTVRGTVRINNPSYQVLSDDGRFLYSTCDEGVAAFQVCENGELALLDKAPVNGLRPHYLDVNSDNSFLISAGYHDAKLTVLRLNDDGSIAGVTDEVFMKSLGSDAGRNYTSHVSCARFSPDERFIMAVDMGMDQIRIYAFNKDLGTTELHDIVRCDMESNPSRLVFSADGKYVYLTYENKSAVTQFAYDAETAAFTKMDTVSSLPDKKLRFNSAVAVKLTADDKHVFVTNSGDNSVAVYNIDPEDHHMEKICVLPVSGEYPRDLAVMPNGRLITAVNQEGNSLTSFKVNYEKGTILMVEKPISLPSPTCIQIRKI